MIFAINKIDKPGANPDKIREQLSNMNILVEDWGGKYQCQEISAKKGINVARDSWNFNHRHRGPGNEPCRPQGRKPRCKLGIYRRRNGKPLQGYLETNF